MELFSTRPDSPESRSLGLPPADVLSISSAGEMAVSLGAALRIRIRVYGNARARCSRAAGPPARSSRTSRTLTGHRTGTSSRSRGGRRYLAGSSTRSAKCLSEPGWVSHVRFSPDGKLIAFLDHPQRGDNTAVVKVVDADGKLRLEGPFATSGSRLVGARRRGLVHGGQPSGHFAFGKTRIVWAFPG